MMASRYQLWKMNRVKAPSKRVEKKWWRRLTSETRKTNLDWMSDTRNRPKTYGQLFDLMDMKRTTKGYRRKK